MVDNITLIEVDYCLSTIDAIMLTSVTLYYTDIRICKPMWMGSNTVNRMSVASFFVLNSSSCEN